MSALARRQNAIVAFDHDALLRSGWQILRDYDRSLDDVVCQTVQAAPGSVVGFYYHPRTGQYMARLYAQDGRALAHSVGDSEFAAAEAIERKFEPNTRGEYVNILHGVGPGGGCFPGVPYERLEDAQRVERRLSGEGYRLGINYEQIRNPSARAVARLAAAQQERDRVESERDRQEQERQSMGWYFRPGESVEDRRKRIPARVAKRASVDISRLGAEEQRARHEYDAASRDALAEDHPVVEAIERLTQRLELGAGDMAWRSGQDWLALGNAGNVDLVLIIEGSDWYGILNGHYPGPHAQNASEAFWDAVRLAGYQGEMLHAWAIGLREQPELRFPEPIDPVTQIEWHQRRGQRYEANPGGWIGPASDVEEYLERVGADRDYQTGAWSTSGGKIVFGLGGDEVVIPEDMLVYVAGRPMNLSDAMQKLGKGFGGFRVVI